MKKSIFFILSLFVGICAFKIDKKGIISDLKVSARTFAVTPKVGTPTGHSRTGHLIEAVYGDIKTSVVLFEQGGNKLCLMTSSLGIESGELRDTCVNILSTTLNIPKDAIVTSGSHNHTIPFLYTDKNKKPEAGTSQLLSWDLGMEFIKKLQEAAANLTKSLVPVDVEWGKAEENRITYNRRGVRPNGKTYFMREEDRQLEGEGYRGLIDPDAKVVVFKDKTGKPVAALSFFTGHPVTAY
ncbi:MAG: hypothetical protein ABIN89_11580, partial [Chitinophagaceae bacterium]